MGNECKLGRTHATIRVWTGNPFLLRWFSFMCESSAVGKTNKEVLEYVISLTVISLHYSAGDIDVTGTVFDAIKNNGESPRTTINK